MTHLEAIARVINSAPRSMLRGISTEKARAILTAIRDPTPAMLAAGERAQCDIDENTAENIWVSMIDAALKEQP